MLARLTARFDAALLPDRARRRPAAAGRHHGASSLYFLRQFRGAFTARLVLVAIGSVADAMLPVFVGWIVGMLATTPVGELWADARARPSSACSRSCCSGPIDLRARRAGAQPARSCRTSSTWSAGRATGTSSASPGASSRTTSPAASPTRSMQAGEAIETAVNLTIDAVWYAGGLRRRRGRRARRHGPGAAGADRGLAGALRRALRLVDAAHRRASEEVSEAKSVMTGRMVDSYTNIQTLKTFAVDGARGRLRRRLGRGPRGARSAG